MQVFQVMDRPALPFEDAVQSPSVGKPKEGFDWMKYPLSCEDP